MDDETLERFMKYVDKTGDCWLWTGSCFNNGYGQFWIDGKMWMTHRLIYIHCYGTIDPGLDVRHKCLPKNCCNLDHLELGTKAENMADKVRDGTDNRGEKSWSAKLTADQVLQIRARSKESRRELGLEFGVSRGTINSIIYRRSWKHV
jgi:hypothetical protein